MNVHKWAVLTRINGQWENIWEEDGEPLLFSSYADAVLELADHLRSYQQAAECGDLIDAPSQDDFRISHVFERATA